MEAFRGKVEAKLENVDDKLREHGDRIIKLEEKQEDVIEMKTLLKIVIEDSKKRDFMFEQQSETLKDIRLNLQEMTSTMSNLNNRVEVVEFNQQQINKNNSVNIAEQFKRLIVYGVPSLIGGLILAALVYFLGLK